MNQKTKQVIAAVGLVMLGAVGAFVYAARYGVPFSIQGMSSNASGIGSFYAGMDCNTLNENISMQFNLSHNVDASQASQNNAHLMTTALTHLFLEKGCDPEAVRNPYVF